jgi:RND family efflux transporter MFP subunit
MFVEEGSKVKKGQVLAVLEHKELDASLASRRATLKQFQAQVTETNAELHQRDREMNRAKRLSGNRVVSAEEYEKLCANVEMSKARVAALEAGVLLWEANVKEVEENIRNMSLYAPFDGTVVEKQGEEGEVITPSAMSTSFSRSAVVTLASLERMEVETDVAENLLSRIAIGQPAEVSVSAVPNKHYRGKLRKIIPMGDRTRGTVKVKVEILDPDASLFPELVATVHFLPDKALNNPNQNQSFVFVPKSALFEENGHSYVWVVDGKSHINKKQVEAAATNDALARVESGLTVGESVVLTPAKTLRENEAVKVAD